MCPPSVFISKLLQKQRQSRTVPQLRKGSSLWIHYLLPVEDNASFNVLLWTRHTENRRRKSIFSWASGNESAWLHSLVFLSASHSASHFLTLRCEFLLSVSLEFCSWFALACISPLKPTIISLPLTNCLSLETCARYSCVCVMAKSMWQCPATTNTHPCQLMTLRGIPRFTSPWLPGWVLAESAVKRRTLAALVVQGTVEVTSATLDDTALAASSSHTLSLSLIFTVYAESERKREIEYWEIWGINWWYLWCSQSSHEGRGKKQWSLSWSVSSEVCLLLFQLSAHYWVSLQNDSFKDLFHLTI